MKRAPTRGGLSTPMLRRALPLIAVASVLAACGGGTVSSDATVAPAVTVAGVGRLPSTIPEVTFAEGVAEGFVLPALEGVPVGAEVAGNRVLMIGDSIFASLSSRQGGAACDQLVPLGWQVAVEAEPGRFADFGERVARTRAGEGWDALVVFMGSNYDGNEDRYRDSMTAILDRFPEQPVVLVTTSLFRSWQNEVNEVIRDLATERQGVRVIEWEQISQNPRLLTRDRLHLTADGQTVLAAAVAQVLGEAPEGDGKCLSAQFTDDSLITGDTTPRSSSSTTTAVSTSSSSVPVSDDADSDDSGPDDSVPDDSGPDDSGPESSVPETTVPETTVPETTIDSSPDTSADTSPDTSPDTTVAP